MEKWWFFFPVTFSHHIKNAICLKNERVKVIYLFTYFCLETKQKQKPIMWLHPECILTVFTHGTGTAKTRQVTNATSFQTVQSWSTKKEDKNVIPNNSQDRLRNEGGRIRGLRREPSDLRLIFHPSSPPVFLRRRFLKVWTHSDLMGQDYESDPASCSREYLWSMELTWVAPHITSYSDVIAAVEKSHCLYFWMITSGHCALDITFWFDM